MTQASLAYRTNEAAIRSGDVPEKYRRLLPFIGGERVLEIGSAEGVLALALARRDLGAKASVTALEMRSERHFAALDLALDWQDRFETGALRFECGSIIDRIELLRGGFDTLVAVRMVYYLRDALDFVFGEVARHIPNVVLCGNGNRARRFHDGSQAADDRLGPMNFYASAQGMVALLERHGYQATVAVADGDPIVTGHRAG